MKKLYLIALLLLLPSNIRAELDKELWDLSNHLTELYIQLGAPTPQPVEPAKVVIDTWDQLVQENNRRKAEIKSKQSEMTVFNGYITASANSPDVISLQNAFIAANGELQNKFIAEGGYCGFFQPENNLHMTLLYLKIPVLSNTISNTTTFADQLKSALMPLARKSESIIKTLSFEYAERNKIMGAKADRKFFSALFTPSDGKTKIREEFMLPFAKAFFTQYPFAWIDYLENIEYHISLALLMGKCTKEEVKEPAALPAVAIFKLDTTTLDVKVTLYTN